MDLVKWDNAKHAIAECKTIDEVKAIRDKASAMKAYAKQIKESVQIRNDLTEIELRAERRAGEMLKDSEFTGKGGDRKSESSNTQSLDNIGINKTQSSRWQKLADIEQDVFENRITEIKEHNEELYKKDLYTFHEKLENENKKINNNVVLNNIVEYGKNIFYESGNYQDSRFDDYIIKKEDSWPTLTTLGRFFHKCMTEYSLREYAEVQTFPDDFVFVGNYSSIKKQIGNAVAPLMGEFISRELEGKTYGDLFSGCGGFSCGLEMNRKIGKWAVEWNINACKTYKANFPDHNVYNENIKHIETLEQVDIIIGGPPCQGFSSAGKQFKDDPRNELYKEYLRIVSVVKPKEFIMENVQQIYKIKDKIIKDFNEINYSVRVELVSGKNIGMRQNRTRCFFIGTLNV